MTVEKSLHHKMFFSGFKNTAQFHRISASDQKCPMGFMSCFVCSVLPMGLEQHSNRGCTSPPDATSRACSVLFMEHPEGLSKEERHGKLWALILLRGGREHGKEVDGSCLIPASLSCLFLSPAVSTALVVEWHISGCHDSSFCQA